MTITKDGMGSKALKKLIKDAKRGEESARETLAYMPVKELYALGAFETLEPVRGTDAEISKAQEKLDACSTTDERVSLILGSVEKYKRKPEPEPKAKWYAVPGGGYVRVRDADRLRAGGFAFSYRAAEARPVPSDAHKKHLGECPLWPVGLLVYRSPEPTRARVLLYVWPEPWERIPKSARTRRRSWHTERVEGALIAPFPG